MTTRLMPEMLTYSRNQGVGAERRATQGAGSVLGSQQTHLGHVDGGKHVLKHALNQFDMEAVSAKVVEHELQATV